MKKLGIIGGASWNSTALYYDHINRAVARRLGGLHSARLVIDSLDFADYAELQQAGDWEAADAMIAGIARGLQEFGRGRAAVLPRLRHAPLLQLRFIRPHFGIDRLAG